MGLDILIPCTLGTLHIYDCINENCKRVIVAIFVLFFLILSITSLLPKLKRDKVLMHSLDTSGLK